MGFILVAQEEFRQQFHVLTPVLFGRRAVGVRSAPFTYHVEMSQNYYPLFRAALDRMNRPHRELTNLLRDPKRNRVFRLEVCPRCDAVFAHGHPQLTHACSATQEI